MNSQQYDTTIIYILNKINQQKNNRIIYFNTFTFRPIYSSSSETKVQYCFDAYESYYKHICSKLINNYHRASKQHLLPITFDFIDASNSTNTKNIRTITTTPHIHSITLVSNKLSNNYERYMRFQFRHELNLLQTMKASQHTLTEFQRSLHRIATFDCQLVKDYEEKQTLEYASKLLQHPVQLNQSLMNMYPKLKTSTSSSYCSNTSLSSTHAI